MTSVASAGAGIDPQRMVRIGILDAGIDQSDPLLARHGNVQIEAWRVSSKRSRWELRPEPAIGGGLAVRHGTKVAAALLNINSNVSIHSIRVPHAHSDAVKFAACWAIDKGCQILNCSFAALHSPMAEVSAGRFKRNREESAILAADRVETTLLDYKSWIDQAYLRGIHVVAAADNGGDYKQVWPAHFPTVIAVGAGWHPMGQCCVRSDRHGRRYLVELSTNGSDPSLGDQDGQHSSFAAPRIAGHLARMIQERPDLTCLTAKAALLAEAMPSTQIA